MFECSENLGIASKRGGLYQKWYWCMDPRYGHEENGGQGGANGEENDRGPRRIVAGKWVSFAMSYNV